MLDRIIVVGLIGEDGFAQVVGGLPVGFFRLHSPTQDALWGAVLAKINEGTTDLGELIKYACQWLELYPIVKSSVHKAISKL